MRSIRFSMTELKAGNKAPDFSGKDQNGNEVSLKGLKGKKVILYFYPKDNTPTCTEEACNLRDNYPLLQKKGYAVIGVSPDTEKSHLKFIQKFDLPFTLLADPENKVSEAFGVYGLKKLYGREYMGILRTTFLIDEKGVIEKVVDKVKSKLHAAQLLED